jgi:hypothetical protein
MTQVALQPEVPQLGLRENAIANTNALLTSRRDRVLALSVDSFRNSNVAGLNSNGIRPFYP